MCDVLGQRVVFGQRANVKASYVGIVDCVGTMGYIGSGLS